LEKDKNVGRNGPGQAVDVDAPEKEVIQTTDQAPDIRPEGRVIRVELVGGRVVTARAGVLQG